MRWWAFVIAAFVFLVAEVSLRNALTLRFAGNVSPSFVAVLAAYLATFAPRRAALWACLGLGLLMDLVMPVPDGAVGGGAGPILGANGLGYVFGCLAIVQIRAMLLRRRALTLAAMTVLFVIAAGIVTIFVYVVHGWYPSEQPYWSDVRPSLELLRRLGMAAYSGIAALLISPVLVWTMPAWGFKGGSGPGWGRGWGR